MSTAVAIVPQGIELPAHLATPEAAAQIAAANAAAAGGIKLGGGFPRISIKANKFHEIDPAVQNGAPQTYLLPAAPGQPQMPMMCLEAVAIAANPNQSKTYYAGDYVEGGAEAPDCQSLDGVTPDSHVAVKQNAVCATCPKNQWGSKVSKLSGKDIKACDDSKQLAVLPGANLAYKALGLTVGKGSLKNWGKYVAALSERNISVSSVVTNITFDNQATGVLVFTYNRLLTAAEYAQAIARSTGDDVKAIVSPARTIALPAPTAQAALPAPGVPVQPVPAPVHIPPPPAAPVPPPAQVLSFGATAAATAGAGTAAAGGALAAFSAPIVAPVETPARKRRTRAEIDAENAAKNPPAPATAGEDLSYLPPAIRDAAALMPAGPARDGLLATFAHLKPVQVAAPTVQAAPAAPVVQPQPAPEAAAGGFGATVQAQPQVQPAAGVASAAGSLADKLRAKLGKPAA